MALKLSLYKHPLNFYRQIIIFITIYYLICLLLKFSIPSVSAPDATSYEISKWYSILSVFVIFQMQLATLLSNLNILTLMVPQNQNTPLVMKFDSASPCNQCPIWKVSCKNVGLQLMAQKMCHKNWSKIGNRIAFLG